MLHTGGTIASRVDYASGGVSAKFSVSDLVELVPEIRAVVNVETELVANMMSEDMNFREHRLIAKAAARWHDKADGIIIGHGTDTLGYTAAALSFMLEGLSKPVLLVGSQRSSDRGSTDAALNLVAAANFIAKSDFAGVAVCMHHTSDDKEIAVIPGTNARKLHTSRRDAFCAVNNKPYALVDSSGGIMWLRDYPKKAGAKLRVLDRLEAKVGLLKSHPNLSSGLLEYFCKNYEGFVIEGTGLGHAPTNTKDNRKNYDILKAYIKKGGIVAMTSQCIFGRVHPYVYTNLRRLRGIGVIYCEDMLAETAFVKLSWLLGNFGKKKAREMMAKNVRGEINQRHMLDDFSLAGLNCQPLRQ